MTTHRLIEPFAGLGAYSLLALSREAAARTGQKYRSEPPVGRMGNKAGFAPAVLRCFGLGRVRWSGVWLNDLDPVCHLFHRLYASNELRTAVARRLWSWVPCPVCHADSVERALLGILRPTSAMLEPLPRPGGCLECNDTGVRDARRLWEWLRSEPVPEDMAEATARAVFLQSRSFSLKPVSITGGQWEEWGWKPEVDDYARVGNPDHVSMDSPRWVVAERLEALPPAGTIHITRQDAALCLPVGDCRDCCVILDPPYLGTSGYQNDASRAAVLELARAWDRAGALVLLHEACPLAEQLGHQWHSRPIDRLRRATSTFWAGEQREWLTANRQPAWWPPEQVGLFG